MIKLIAILIIALWAICNLAVFFFQIIKQWRNQGKIIKSGFINEIKDLILFHGGCHGCTRQLFNGVDFCYDCQYFEVDWDKPNLNNSPPTKADTIREEIKKRRGTT